MQLKDTHNIVCVCAQHSPQKYWQGVCTITHDTGTWHLQLCHMGMPDPKTQDTKRAQKLAPPKRLGVFQPRGQISATTLPLSFALRRKSCILQQELAGLCFLALHLAVEATDAPKTGLEIH